MSVKFLLVAILVIGLVIGLVIVSPSTIRSAQESWFLLGFGSEDGITVAGFTAALIGYWAIWISLIFSGILVGKVSMEVIGLFFGLRRRLKDIEVYMENHTKAGKDA